MRRSADSVNSIDRFGYSLRQNACTLCCERHVCLDSIDIGPSPDTDSDTDATSAAAPGTNRMPATCACRLTRL